MSLGKKDIVKNISIKAHIISSKSAKLLDFFLSTIKSKSSFGNIKLSNFGTFVLKETIERVGRNPKTKIEYAIPSTTRVSFKASEKVKKLIN